MKSAHSLKTLSGSFKNVRVACKPSHNANCDVALQLLPQKTFLFWILRCLSLARGSIRNEFFPPQDALHYPQVDPNFCDKPVSLHQGHQFPPSIQLWSLMRSEKFSCTKPKRLRHLWEPLFVSPFDNFICRKRRQEVSLYEF